MLQRPILPTYAFNEDDKIAFHCYNSDNGNINTTDVVKVTFANLSFNYGNGFDIETDVFTAPVSGVYRFDTYVYFGGIDYSSKSATVYLYKNNVKYSIIDIARLVKIYGGSIIMHLDEGDSVDIRVGSNDDTYYISDYSGRSATCFMGELVFRD